MKVVHVVEAWKGGIASYVEALIKDQILKGYSVFLVADREQISLDFRALGVEIIDYRSSRNFFHIFSIARRLFKAINLIEPDVIHCHSTFPGIYIRMLKYPCRVIYTPHAWSFFKRDVGIFFRWIFRQVELFFSRRSSLIICMSLEEARAAIRLGIAPEKISLIYTGIPDVSEKYPDECLVDEGPSLECQELVPLKVGFFGRFDYQKGFDLLIAALPKINDNVEVHLYGGFVREEEYSLDPRFINHGWIEHKCIHEHMRLMDAIVIPSRWEGFALTPLEAMRAGRAVIISNFSSLPEVVVDGFNGRVMPEYSPDILAQTLNSLGREECRRMGHNARIVYEQSFAFDKFAELVERAYKG